MRILGLEVRRAGRKAYDIRALARDVGFGTFGSELNPIKIIDEGYRTNPTVFAAVQKVTTAAAVVPWLPQVTSQDGEATDLQASHPVSRLLTHPNQWHSWAYIVEALVGSLMLFGKAYAYLNGPGNPEGQTAANPGPPPTEVLWIPKQWVEPEVDDARPWEVTAYKVTTQTGALLRLPPHRVVDPCSWNPASPWTGQGRIQAAASSIDTANLGRTWNRNLLQQGARPPGALTTEQTLSDATFERLKQEISADFSGATKAGKTPILEGGLKWQPTGMTAADMEFQNGLREVKREISLSLGVDPSLLGDPEVKTYANYAEARIALYQDTVLPILDVVRAAITLRLRAWFPDVDFLLDQDQVPVLADARRQTWKTYAELVTQGLLTRNEARREMGFDDVDGGDVVLVPISLVPLDSLGETVGGAEEAEEPEEDPVPVEA